MQNTISATFEAVGFGQQSRFSDFSLPFDFLLVQFSDFFLSQGFSVAVVFNF